jgi:Protein of unknown function (DUF3306)
MSEEDFLKRWSRRKREVAKAEPADVKPAPVPDSEVPPNQTAGAPPEFDISTLPPIDSITAVSDVKAFLQAGVPTDLTRAALRRVWTADPAIRDFVGLAENAWDFTDPNAMPGFGPLETTDEVRRMIADVVRQIGEAAQPDTPAQAPRHVEVVENSNDSSVINPVNVVDGGSNRASAADEAQEAHAQILGNQVMLQSNIEERAAQHVPTEAQEKPKQLSRRGHGGALPR